MPRTTARLFHSPVLGSSIWVSCILAGIATCYFTIPAPISKGKSTGTRPIYTTKPADIVVPPPTKPQSPSVQDQIEAQVKRSLEIENQFTESSSQIHQNKTTAGIVYNEICSQVANGKKNTTLTFISGLEREERASKTALDNCNDAYAQATETKAHITKLRKEVLSLRYSNQLYQAKNTVQKMEDMLAATARLASDSERYLSQLKNIRDEVRTAVKASGQNSTPTASIDSARKNIIRTVGNTGLQDLTYKVLHLLVGASPNGKSLNSLFASTVADMTNGTNTNGSSIIKGINQLSNNYPARSVKLKHVGACDEVLEIITARVFTDAFGKQVRRYGKTRITLNSSNRITSISDELYPEGTAEYEIGLSPGYTAVPYNRKTIISNTTE